MIQDHTQLTDFELEERIRSDQQILAQRNQMKEAEKLKALFPLKTKIYAHISKESNDQTARLLGLNDKQHEMFRYASYEMAIDIVIDYNGSAKATHLNGKELKEPVTI